MELPEKNNMLVVICLSQYLSSSVTFSVIWLLVCKTFANSLSSLKNKHN